MALNDAIAGLLLRNVWEYSTTQIEARFGTIDLLADTDPGAGVSITPLEPIWTERPGCDGEVVRVRASRFRANVEASISSASRAHASLMAHAALDAISGAGPRPFFLLDRNSGVSYVSPLAYLTSIPPVSYRDVASYATWTISCPYLTVAVVPSKSVGAPVPV